MIENYSDPPVPEGINVQHDHPLLEFGGLLVGAALITIVIVVALVLSASWLSRYIPFAYEKSLASRLFTMDLAKKVLSENQKTPLQLKRTQYLQGLADRITQAQGFPEDMSVTVHYVEENTVNAFATLGGHVVLYSGLVDKLESENALAMLLAHEIAHVRNRDPVVALGRGTALMLGLLAISGTGDASGMAHSVVGDISLLTALNFSRRQEEAADVLALETVIHLYGHASGAEQLYAILQKESQGKEMPAFFSTHPGSNERYERVRSTIPENQTAPLIALPDFMTAAGRQSSNAHCP